MRGAGSGGGGPSVAGFQSAVAMGSMRRWGVWRASGEGGQVLVGQEVGGEVGVGGGWWCRCSSRRLWRR